MTPPLLSVLMPVWNASAYLEASLRSIQRQTASDMEILVVDDGSTDRCPEILRSFEKSEERLIWWSRPNRGLIASRNELLSRASGRYIAWIDADDEALPNRLSRQLEMLERDPRLVCVGTFARQIDPDGAELDIEMYPEDHAAIVQAQRHGSGMRFPTTMAVTAFAREIGGFREPFRMGEDLDFLLRLGERGRLGNVPEVLYLYRQHLDSVCAGIGANWPRYRDVILELADERRRSGTDRLERGEPVSIDGIDARPQTSFRVLVFALWSEAAARNGNLPLAAEYALASVRSGPLHRDGWAAAWRIVKSVSQRWGRAP